MVDCFDQGSKFDPGIANTKGWIGLGDWFWAWGVCVGPGIGLGYLCWTRNWIGCLFNTRIRLVLLVEITSTKVAIIRKLGLDFSIFQS